MTSSNLATDGDGSKDKSSQGIYALAIPIACIDPWISQCLYVAAALLWLIPDRRIEKAMAEQQD